MEMLFAPIGLSLERPGTGQVLALSPLGEQHVSTREEIVAQIASRSNVNFQWWFTVSEDVYCGLHTDTENDQWRIALGLDGLEPHNIRAIVRQLLLYFKAHCGTGDAAALVVDTFGGFDEIDWDAVVVGEVSLREVPDIVILPRWIGTPGLESLRADLPECPLHAILREEHENSPLHRA